MRIRKACGSAYLLFVVAFYSASVVLIIDFSTSVTRVARDKQKYEEHRYYPDHFTEVNMLWGFRMFGIRILKRMVNVVTYPLFRWCLTQDNRLTINSIDRIILRYEILLISFNP